jgi:ribosomal protein S18 acetylase RimI-like enzyme
MIIRKGTIYDLDQVLNLVYELANYENAKEEVKNSIEAMREDGFGENPVFGFFVAENQGAIVGTVVYYFRYSTWKGKMLYIEDLIVTENFRKAGIGTKLMDEVMVEATKTNCNGVQWQVLDWNEPAIKFYRKYKPKLDGEWINFMISREQLESYRSIS